MLHYENILFFLTSLKIRLDLEQIPLWWNFSLDSHWIGLEKPYISYLLNCSVPIAFVLLLFLNMNHNGFSTITVIVNCHLLNSWLNSPPLLVAFVVIVIHLKYECWCHILFFKGNLFKAICKMLVTWILGYCVFYQPCHWKILKSQLKNYFIRIFLKPG